MSNMGDHFPRAAKYDEASANSMGPNVLFLTEALCSRLDLEPGMRVLDLGCGKAISSIFLAREFDVQVWATDLWVKPTQNWKRIREAKVEDKVFPIYAEARALPYANDFFDAVISIDAYHYFGTDALYLGGHLLSLLKRGGWIGIVAPGLMAEIDGSPPAHLHQWIQDWDDPGQFFSF